MFRQPKKWLYSLVMFALVACSSSPTSNNSMGTKYGDEAASRAFSVNLDRVSETPMDETAIYYFMQRYAGTEIESISLANGRVSLFVDSESRKKFPLVRDNGRYLLQGRDGEAYTLRYVNHSQNTYEVITSVDGLDVITGQQASRKNSGYVLRPNGELVINGFRKNESSVALFIFGKAHQSYAANTPQGSVQNSGVIGTVLYELDDPNRRPVSAPNAFPGDNPFAMPPR